MALFVWRWSYFSVCKIYQPEKDSSDKLQSYFVTLVEEMPFVRVCKGQFGDGATHTDDLKPFCQWALLIMNSEQTLCAYLTRYFHGFVHSTDPEVAAFAAFYYNLVMDGRSMQFCIPSMGLPSCASRWSRQVGLSISHRSHSWTAQQTDTSQ